MNENTCRSIEQIFEGSTFNKSERKKLTFENEKLNLFFENGIINYSLIELVGSPGSGKTQFALTLCAEQLIKINKEKKEDIVFYIYFNRTFPIQRLTTIIENKLKFNENNYTNYYIDEKKTNANKLPNANHIYSKKYNINQNEQENLFSFKTNKNDIVRNLLANLYIQKIHDENEFFSLFQKNIHSILKYNKISLLVIDSFNSILNGNENLDSYKKYQLYIKMSLILKQISYENNIFIILINSSNINKHYSDFSFNISDFIINSSCSNTVIIFKKTKKNNEQVRKMFIKCSEFLRMYKTLTFQITDSGVEAL
ncbi:hypothetical protein YYC_05485 [Plasmodium yoelii 17X]|uniref:Rad51-like C-terminal domain-containing protein n=3 Tax=Plasmodium yoelii TaxID=5861 RepID=A0AAE9WPR7_PLAYO|nr:conserved Plasmodium protein, unknown function [Plasmodium yoelii]ETB56663.1 hypothetical protein YYC_05485 [Plasmodium yoelii 17X]WBY56465.1 hypothetical protein Py17XNL_000704301 [Plasmodium yoelii yoelii]CDU17335.1 conserved Plasmodium protein, unknown function [Plasmodium yoelii]VTZ76606.1 conserved Plasmodium protein, unknown function [Plasmodium yoelii]|eukprot:XP_022811850.1 conserved Plasmodium protein, unknown function [Plasmodium yoelii]